MNDLMSTDSKARGTVLLVDDEQHVLDALGVMLRREPYEILTATSGRACLEILARRVVDVIVSDEQMPGMLGSELLTQVSRDYPATVRIILTGEPSVAGAARAINDGAIYRFLQKPCPSEQFVDALRNAFRVGRLNDAAARMLDVLHEESARLVSRPTPEVVLPVRVPWLCPKQERADLNENRVDRLTLEEGRSVSPREREVLALVVAGSRVAEIAKALFISTHTVRNHLKSLFSKLQVHSQAELRQRFVA